MDWDSKTIREQVCGGTVRYGPPIVARSNCYGSLPITGLITRSLAEMTRIGEAFGASPITFLSLAGVGDLLLTCTSTNSRNYTVGYRLGKGETLDNIIKTLGSVAEGVSTAKGYKEVIDRVGVEAPIAQAVYSVLYEVMVHVLPVDHHSFQLLPYRAQI